MAYARQNNDPPLAVFLGPTLDSRDARMILPGVYLPPAEQGSLVKLVLDRPVRGIVLIDGAFGRVPAVRHKEILWVLSRGIPVWGAASMGALRAAELAGFGMQGFGFVYRWFRRTPLLDDDEVAVAMGPSEMGSQPLSDALVNIRASLRRAERNSGLRRELRLLLERLATDTYFPQRTYSYLIEEARRLLGERHGNELDDLSRWLAAHAIDRKRIDAVGLLRWIAAHPGAMRKPVGLMPFVMTESWAYDLESAGVEAWADRPEGARSSSGPDA
jgi:hypothetical protein